MVEAGVMPLNMTRPENGCAFGNQMRYIHLCMWKVYANSQLGDPSTVWSCVESLDRVQVSRVRSRMHWSQESEEKEQAIAVVSS